MSSPRCAENQASALVTLSSDQERNGGAVSPRGRLLVAGCRSGSGLSEQVALRCRQPFHGGGDGNDVVHLRDIDFRFANSETCVRLGRHVGGRDVFLFQALCDPTSDRTVNENYVAFLIAARAFRKHGANHVTAVLPYLAYGRQDNPTEFTREPTTARLMADLSIAAGVDRLITWHPHCGQLRGFYGGLPTSMLDPLSLFAEEFRQFGGRRDVIVVAPDAGASKLVTYFSKALDLECAIGAKFRPRPDEAVISQIAGDFSGKSVAIILDDELSTGGTLVRLVDKLVRKHGIREVYMGVSHNRCVPEARERLIALNARHNLRRVVVTNSIPQTEVFRAMPFLSIRCLSGILAPIIHRTHHDLSVSELFERP